MSKKTADKTAALAVVKVLREGLESRKCRRCGNMASAFDKAAKAFSASDDPQVVEQVETVRELRRGLDKKAFDDAGCGGCTGNRAKKLLAASFAQPRKRKRMAGSSPQATPLSRYVIETLVDAPRLRCTRLDKKGRPSAVIAGNTADDVIAAAVESGLVKKASEALWLGAALARAEPQA